MLFYLCLSLTFTATNDLISWWENFIISHSVLLDSLATSARRCKRFLKLFLQSYDINKSFMTKSKTSVHHKVKYLSHTETYFPAMISSNKL